MGTCSMTWRVAFLMATGCTLSGKSGKDLKERASKTSKLVGRKHLTANESILMILMVLSPRVKPQYCSNSMSLFSFHLIFKWLYSSTNIRYTFL